MCTSTVACPNTQKLDSEFWKHVGNENECRLVIHDDAQEHLKYLLVDAQQRGIPVNNISWIAV